jgi:putative spermidine/putrescine transport system substrate-binding protein
MSSKRIVPTHPSRRRLLLGGAAAAAAGLGLGGRSAHAQAPAVVRGQTMTISLWGGPFAKAVREALLPSFEKDHGIKVAIEEGISSDSVAKVQMERERPKRTVIGIDDIYIPHLRGEKLIAPVTAAEVPNLAEVHPPFIIEDGYGIGAAVNFATMFYNTDRIKTPPDSYAAFWDAAYKGRVSLASAHSTFGIMTLMAATALKTGKPITEAQYDIDPGFAMIKALKPDLYSIVDSSITVAPLLAKGEIWLTFINSRFMTPYSLKNGPVARAKPKEGAFMLLNTMGLVANSPLQAQGKDFINRMLSDKVQLAMCTAGYTGPVNRTVNVPDELKPYVPYGEDVISKLVRIDLQNFSKNWSRWQNRWNKEIAS